MSRMMRRHADSLDGRNQRMFRDAGVLGDDPFQRGGDGLLARRWKHRAGVVERLHGFVAGPA